MTEYTRFQLALKPDDERDQQIIRWLTSHPDGVTGAIRQAVEGFTQSITQKPDEPAPRQAADITQSVTQKPDVGDDSLIVQGFKWFDSQQQARHDVLMTALDNLTAQLAGLRLQAPIAPGTPAPSEPERLSDAELEKRKVKMLKTALAWRDKE